MAVTAAAFAPFLPGKAVRKTAQAKVDLTQIFRALSIAMAILLCTVFLAGLASNSRLYRQSQILSSLVSQDSVDMKEIVINESKREMLLKFLGAVTSAYIDFELIPVNESHTFTIVFQSLDDAVFIDSFAYHRRDLSISGSAEDDAGYDRFVQKLSDSGYFDSVSGHSYVSTDNRVRFDIKCAAKQNTAYTIPF